MDKACCKLLFVVCVLIAVGGCSGPPQTEKTAPARPDLTISLGSLNLSNFGRRLEKKDITSFVRALKREQIEVLAVQGLTRYPGIESRVDFLKELSSLTEMRNVFGEMMNNSGRQTGNAVFSTFPFHSNRNQAFDGVKSAKFEAALHTAIDGGICDVSVVSVQFPPGATAEDQSLCVKTIVALNAGYEKNPFVVAGNLPTSESLRSLGSFEDVHSIMPGSKNSSSKVWYSSQGTLKPLAARTVDTDLGSLVVVQFGLFRLVQP